MEWGVGWKGTRVSHRATDYLRGRRTDDWWKVEFVWVEMAISEMEHLNIFINVNQTVVSQDYGGPRIFLLISRPTFACITQNALPLIHCFQPT